MSDPKSVSTTQPWTWLSILLTLLGAGVAWLGLRIQKIECYVGTSACPAEVEANFGTMKGHPIFFLTTPLNKLAQNVSTYFVIEDYSVSLPGTLKIKLQTQTPAYQVRRAGTSDSLVINQAGQIMGQQLQTGAVTFVIADPVWQQEFPEAKMSSTLHQRLSDLTDTIARAQLPLRKIYLPDSDTVVLYLENEQVVIGDAHDFTTALKRLELIMDHLRLQPSQTPVAEIDVRFEFPVLRETINVPRHDAL